VGEVSTQFIILVRSLLEGTMFEKKKKGIKTDFLNGELSHFFLEIRNNFFENSFGIFDDFFSDFQTLQEKKRRFMNAHNYGGNFSGEMLWTNF
jgi:hypothetical protein